MSLITQKSQLEQDLAEKDAGVLRAATALHHAPTEPGRSDIVFDGTAFVYVASEPEPSPEPDPE